MLGTWRLILALFVANAHLAKPWWMGAFAVISFFVISGYLMTYIMNQNYSYTLTGFRGFWVNRVLRLYPSYFAAAALSLAIIFALPPDFVQDLNKKIALPGTFYEIFVNFFLWGLFHAPPPGGALLQVPFIGPISLPATVSLIPPAWALAIELIYYLLISAWFGKTMLRSWILLGAGVAYLVWIFFTFGKFYVYFSPLSAALPFGVGAVLYHFLARPGWREFIQRYMRILFPLALTLYVGVLYWGTQTISIALGRPSQTIILFNVLASAFLLGVLVCFRGGTRFRKIDSFLGDLSYPTYLMHWQAAIIVIWFYGVQQKSQLEVYLCSMALVLALSLLDRQFIGKPINTLRDRVKQRLTLRASGGS